MVNVGGGNGLYIAGLGRRLPGAELVVFELDGTAREVIAATLARNGLLDRARLLAAADPTGLESACAGAGPLLVVMDVEGAEVELTDLSRVPSLAGATLLVETHDFARPGCQELVTGRFAGSHTIRTIETRARTIEDFPAALSPLLLRFAPRRCEEAVQEWRPTAQAWLLLEPRGAPRFD